MDVRANLWGAVSEKLGPDLTRKLLETGEKAAALGGRAYIVGGTVRDLLLGRQIVDIDLAFDGPSGGVAALVDEMAVRWGALRNAQSEFETISLSMPDGMTVDFAMTRAEEYPYPGALPKVRAAGIESDLKRRDFTINVMAVSLDPMCPGELLDPYAGRMDLDRRIIRVLHHRSFIDDPTRIFRSLRFSARFGFALERETEGLLKTCLDGNCLDTVSGPRLLSELVKTSSEDSYAVAFDLMERYHCLRAIHQCLGLDPAKKQMLVRTKDACEMTGRVTGEQVRKWVVDLLCLSRGASRPEWEAICRRLDMDRKARETGSWVKDNEARVMEMLHSEDEAPSRICAALGETTPEALAFLAASAGCAPSGNAMDAKRLAGYWLAEKTCRPALDGHDLIALGYSPGPRLGGTLRELKNARLDGKVSTEREEIALARSLLRARRTRKET